MGQCSHPLDRLQFSNEKHESILNLAQQKAPLVLNLVTGFGLSVFFGVIVKQYSFPIVTLRTAFYILTLCHMTRYYLILHQMVFQTSKLREIIRLLQSAEIFLKNKMNSSISYKELDNRLRIKILFIACVYFQVFAIYSFQHIGWWNGKAIGITVRVLLFFSTITLFHVNFYVNLLCSNLKHLNSIIVRDTRDLILRQKEIKCVANEKMKRYKFIHYRLWQIGQSINSYFGWIILVIAVQCFGNMVYCWYWFVKMFHLQFSYIPCGKFWVTLVRI